MGSKKPGGEEPSRAGNRPLKQLTNPHAPSPLGPAALMRGEWVVMPGWRLPPGWDGVAECGGGFSVAAFAVAALVGVFEVCWVVLEVWVCGDWVVVVEFVAVWCGAWWLFVVDWFVADPAGGVVLFALLVEVGALFSVSAGGLSFAHGFVRVVESRPSD